jgi:hypothetical protein
LSKFSGFKFVTELYSFDGILTCSLSAEARQRAAEAFQQQYLANSLHVLEVKRNWTAGRETMYGGTIDLILFLFRFDVFQNKFRCEYNNHGCANSYGSCLHILITTNNRT